MRRWQQVVQKQQNTKEVRLREGPPFRAIMICLLGLLEIVPQTLVVGVNVEALDTTLHQDVDRI